MSRKISPNIPAGGASGNRSEIFDAQSLETAPERLCYLVGSRNPQVRKALAGNPRTPPQADRLLCDDLDEGVRVELARKIGRLLAGLTAEELSGVSEFTLATLERLASDELPNVRSLLAEEIKALHSIPKAIIDRLARDVEAIVAAPILEYSPLLTDEDLIEVIAAARVDGVISAVARRRGVSEDVSDAIVATLEIPAVAALLVNSSARIREETLYAIAAHAATTAEWHAPLVMRPELSVRVMRRIAGFVSSALLEQLQQRSGLDDDLTAFLRRRMQDRLRDAPRRKLSTAAEFTQAEVMRRHGLGCLDDEFVVRAARDGWREAVELSLAVLTEIERKTAARILRGRNARAIIALCWEAGLGMRTAMEVQIHIARLPPTDVIAARNGTDFPLSSEEMRMLLGVFNVECAP